MDKYIGRLLDNRYEILEVIGTGGMAVVYKARCHRLNRLVAIKILKDDYLQDEDFRRRFHSESQAVAMLSHPNIVSVYDVSSSIMADYIVMELIEGISLKQYMEKKGVLNWKETLHFAIQIARALEHAHSRGIVHRDIKPHNVMVLKNGSVKVTDFGIARMMSKGNTLTKEALGSVHYISPEQAKGGRVDSRSDIYSLGVVMYEMMTGRPPYDGDSPVSVAIAHINGGAPMPSTLNPNIPGGLEQIIMKAMAHEVDARYSSASQMLADMDEFRKNPAILFDYNIPPLDAVTNLNHPPLVLDTPKTTAERVAGRKETTQNRSNKQDSTTHMQRRNREQEARRRAQEEKRSKAATVAIISCSVVAVIAVVVFMVALLGGGMLGQKEKYVDVPLLIGQNFDELPEYAGLQIIKDEVYDDLHPSGKILDQNPNAGDQVVEGTKIVVTVSMGPTPQKIVMGDLENMSEDRARSYLENQNLNLLIQIKEEYSDKIAEGNVIRTEPAEGVELTTGMQVTLYVSKGPEILTGNMPNVVDREKDAAVATLKKQNLDLQISLEEVYDSSIAEGNVVRTEPAMGEELKTGQNVRLYISKGPETEVMPNVIGMSVDKACNIITNAGFKTPKIEYVPSQEEKATVVTQSVEKNTEIPLDTEILLEISEGPQETVSTVTKDVVIGLRGSTAAAECRVSVIRDGSVVFSGTVAQGVDSITVPGQTGSGTVYYEVVINDSDGWIEKVSF